MTSNGLTDVERLFVSIPFEGHARSWKEIPGNPEKQSAVLVPVLAEGECFSLMLVERSKLLRRHPGQISFPGGARDEDDHGPVDTALREFEEETGISGSKVEVIGNLTEEYAYSSDFILYPVVGFLGRSFSAEDIRPDPVEVERIFTVPLAFFFGVPKMEEFFRNGMTFGYPVYTFKGLRIWGATAWIIRRLVIAMGKDPGPGCL
ncbi:MAG TPA: CoA pyrophosphatase [Thermovirgaceae bacterium]|jgi:8-oxo-dGTP pyrophosphatase MutT (NUDIX family)|nr:CoA pyrophosphatase [Thermovirgaceae bacterium]